MKALEKISVPQFNIDEMQKSKGTIFSKIRKMFVMQKRTYLYLILKHQNDFIK